MDVFREESCFSLLYLDTKQTVIKQAAATASPDTEAELGKGIFPAPAAYRMIPTALLLAQDIHAHHLNTDRY